jgi:hypothetical protein
MKPIDLMVCVNDYRNGAYAGRCAGLHISDFLHLDPRVLPEPRCTLTARTFSIHRTKIPILNCTDWVGNWCWNSIRIDVEDAAVLIAAALNEKINGHPDKEPIWAWGFEEAQGDSGIGLSNAREASEPITPARVLGAIYENAMEVA